MHLNAQVKLNERGFGDVQLGKNIKEIKGVSPFSSYRERNFFKVFPSEKDFYVWSSENSTLFDSAQIRYAFVSADSSGLVIKISLWINDPGHTVASQLTKTYGEPKFKVETGAYGWRNRSTAIWELSPHISAFLAQPLEVDAHLKFEITKLEFYYPHNLDKISKHIIGPRSSEELH